MSNWIEVDGGQAAPPALTGQDTGSVASVTWLDLESGASIGIFKDGNWTAMVDDDEIDRSFWVYHQGPGGQYIDLTRTLLRKANEGIDNPEKGFASLDFSVLMRVRETIEVLLGIRAARRGDSR